MRLSVQSEEGVEEQENERFDPVPWNESDQDGFCLAGKLGMTDEEKVKIWEAANA